MPNGRTRLELTGMFTADSYLKWTGNKGATVDTKLSVWFKGRPDPLATVFRPTTRPVGPVLNSTTIRVVPAGPAQQHHEWTEEEVDALSTTLGAVSLGLLAVSIFAPIAPVTLPLAGLFGIGATYVSCVNQKFGGSCGLEIATMGVGAGISSQVIKHGGSEVEGAIWDLMTGGPMLLMN